MNIKMTLDSVHEFQYRLAAFLAKLELQEYPKQYEHHLSESKQNLEYLASYRKQKKEQSSK
jgi:hypothetical protein